MTWLDGWRLAYETYVWLPFCWWLMKHPIMGTLAIAVALALMVAR